MNRQLGEDLYGSWLLVVAITGILKLIALGIPLSAVKAITEHTATDDKEGLNVAIGTCKAIYLLLGTLTLGVGALLYLFFDLVYLDERISVAYQDATRWAFGIVVVHVAITYVMQLPYGILAGHHEFVRQNKIMIGITLARFSMIVGVLVLSGSIVALAALEIIIVCFEFLVPWRFIRQKYPKLRMNLADADKQMMKKIFAFSGFVVVLQIGGRLAFHCDSMVIVGWLDTASNVDYGIANSFVVYLIELMIAIGGVIMPMAAKLKAQDKVHELRDVFLKWSKIAMSLALMVGLYLLVLGPEFIGWWMGKARFVSATAPVMPALMISSFIFLPIRAVALPMLLGLGDVKFPALLFLAMGLLNLGISIVLVQDMGLEGVALGTAIPNVIYAIVVWSYACRKIGESPLRYLKYVIPKSIIGSLPVVAFLLWAKSTFDTSSFLVLFGTGLGMVLLFGIIWIFFVYRRDPLIDLAGKLGEKIGKKSS